LAASHRAPDPAAYLGGAAIERLRLYASRFF